MAETWISYCSRGADSPPPRSRDHAPGPIRSGRGYFFASGCLEPVARWPGSRRADARDGADRSSYKAAPLRPALPASSSLATHGFSGYLVAWIIHEVHANNPGLPAWRGDDDGGRGRGYLSRVPRDGCAVRTQPPPLIRPGPLTTTASVKPALFAGLVRE